MDAHVSVGSSTMDYQRSKTIEFYYIPSSFDQDFTVENTSSADLFHNDTDDPFVIYKNVWVSGDDNSPDIDFTIKNGKTILHAGCIFTINKPTEFLVENELFEFICGSNLRLIMEPGTGKLLKNCSFDGANSSDRMVMCYGEFTGASSTNSAATSKLEFINAAFLNYRGTALHVAEGRATVVNSTFHPILSTSVSSTAILVSQKNR